MPVPQVHLRSLDANLDLPGTMTANRARVARAPSPAKLRIARGAESLRSETRNPKPETRNPKPETRNLKPETRNLPRLDSVFLLQNQPRRGAAI